MAWPGLSEASLAHLCQLSLLIIKVLFGTLSQLASQAITTLCAKRKGFKNNFFLTHKDMTDEVTDNGSRGLRKLCGEMDYDDWAMAAQDGACAPSRK